MDMVCKSLSQPDLNGLQVCLEWGQYQSAWAEIAPHLTYSTANAYLGAIAVVFATVFIIRRVVNLLGVYN